MLWCLILLCVVVRASRDDCSSTVSLCYTAFTYAGITKTGSRDGRVAVVANYTIGCTGRRSILGRDRTFFSVSKMTPGLKWRGKRADNSSPYSIGDKNEWSYTSIPLSRHSPNYKTVTAQVGIQPTYGRLHVSINGSPTEMQAPSSNTMDPDRPQHDRPDACVIAQQYSSGILGSLCFHFRKKKFGALSDSFFKSFIGFNFGTLKSLSRRARGQIYFQYKNVEPPRQFSTVCHFDSDMLAAWHRVSYLYSESESAGIKLRGVLL